MTPEEYFLKIEQLCRDRVVEVLGHLMEEIKEQEELMTYEYKVDPIDFEVIIPDSYPQELKDKISNAMAKKSKLERVRIEKSAQSRRMENSNNNSNDSGKDSKGKKKK